jgi:hypothetical protein
VFSHSRPEIRTKGVGGVANHSLSKPPLSSGIITAMLDLFTGLEEMLLRHNVRRSPDEVDALLAPDFFEFGRSGFVLNRQQNIVRLLPESVVLVTYRSVRRDPVSIKEWHALRSSVRKLIDGRWQMIFHRGTPTRPSP